MRLGDKIASTNVTTAQEKSASFNCKRRVGLGQTVALITK